MIIKDPVDGTERHEKRIDITYFHAHGLWNIGNGYFSPCDGFHGPEEIRSILEDNSLPGGVKWSIPITLQIEPDDWESTKGGDIVELIFEGRTLAIMEVYEKFVLDMEWYLGKMFGPRGYKHPYVENMRRSSGKSISGKILHIFRDNFPFAIKAMDTESVRNMLVERGFSSVCGFQTRNVPHRGHEFLHKMALLNCDSLLLTPSLGPKKDGDLQDSLILMAYEKYIKNYLPAGTTFLIPVNYAMMYGGPREAFLHMIMRKNMGCSHFIIGRDHAGVGDLYGQSECKEYLNSLGNVGITPMFVDEVFFCSKCDQLSTERTCPHSEEYRTKFSGTMIRDMVKDAKTPDKNVMRGDIYQIIRENVYVRK